MMHPQNYGGCSAYLRIYYILFRLIMCRGIGRLLTVNYSLICLFGEDWVDQLNLLEWKMLCAVNVWLTCAFIYLFISIKNKVKFLNIRNKKVNCTNISLSIMPSFGQHFKKLDRLNWKIKQRIQQAGLQNEINNLISSADRSFIYQHFANFFHNKNNQYMKNFLLPFFLLAVVFGQTPKDTNQVSLEDLRANKEISNPNFLRIINNYFGCKTWTDGFCSECSKNFYFNANGVCCEIKQNCKEFNTQVGICQKCYNGFEIVDGQCKTVDTTVKHRGCKSFDGGACIECSQMFYFGENGVCQEVDGNCRVWEKNGICTECYRGFLPQGRNCAIDKLRDSTAIFNLYGINALGSNGQVLQLVEINKLCAVWDGVNCIKCADRTFLNTKQICEKVDDQCNTWDRVNGACLTCYRGYTLTQGKCQIRSVQVNQSFTTVNGITGIDTNNDGVLDFCKTWAEDICIDCADRAYFINGVCQPVSDQCKSFNRLNGRCTECYVGFQLKQNGICQLSFTLNTTQFSSIGCKTWDWQNQICLECSLRWRFNEQKVCILQDELCEVFLSNGNCQKCYNGYQVKIGGGPCVKSAITQVSDLGCKTWDWQNQICLECSPRRKFNAQNKCILLDDNCEIFNQNQVCIKCYKGFSIQNNTCVIDKKETINFGCKKWDWDAQTCLQCSARWYFNSEKICVAISDSCQQFTALGVCTKCYKGYSFNQQGQCILSAVQQVSDLGCKTWDWENQKCLQCSARRYFNNQGRCVNIQENCEKFNDSGACTKCYKGYSLDLQGRCIISVVQQVSDFGCKTWDWDSQTCLQCSARWYFNNVGTCVRVDNFCQKYVNGVCSACYKGYDLFEGFCFPSKEVSVKDLGCKTWDWDSQICLECSNRWYFNAQKKCTEIDDLCEVYTSDGTCTKCYQGYIVQNRNKCVLGNPFCKASDAQGRCLACYNGFVLYQNNCISLAKISNIALYYAECCPEKLEALKK